MRMVHQRPAGRLRVDASVPVMLHCVVPHVGDFRRQYPGISLELTSNDRIVDLMEHRTDVALRMGPLTDSTLHARALRSSRRWVMASPDYVARRGAPATVDELHGHEVLGFTQPESLNVWPVRHAGGSSYLAVPTLATSSGETQRQLALRGVGIACLSDFVVREDIKAGRLGETDGIRAHGLPAAHARRLPPQHPAVAAHRVFPGFLRGADVTRAGGAPGRGPLPGLCAFGPPTRAARGRRPTAPIRAAFPTGSDARTRCASSLPPWLPAMPPRRSR